MSTFEKKPQKDTRHADVSEAAQYKMEGTSPVGFAGNRESDILQRRLQAMADASPQVQQTAQFNRIVENSRPAGSPLIQRKRNQTGLPDNLKSGIESLSGISMDHVKVHYNSSEPAQLNANAFAKGHDIHVAPGQDRHLAHEAWHVVQQAQGRVRPATQMKAGMLLNDDIHLENEADVMGARALSLGAHAASLSPVQAHANHASSGVRGVANPVVQRNTDFKFKTHDLTYNDPNHPGNMVTEKVGVEAEAWIDPSNPIMGTTTPGRVGVYDDLNLTQGHLINAQVGGPGRSENFFPITASLNAQHKNNIELPLKYRVLELLSMRQNNVYGWANRHLYYKVTVVPTTWNAFTAAAAGNTQLHCQMAYTNRDRQIIPTLPTSQFTATDSSHALHQSLDTALAAMGAGAPGAPTGAGGGRHYTLGATFTPHGGVPTRNLLLNGAVIGTVEDH